MDNFDENEEYNSDPEAEGAKKTIKKKKKKKPRKTSAKNKKESKKKKKKRRNNDLTSHRYHVLCAGSFQWQCAIQCSSSMLQSF